MAGQIPGKVLRTGLALSLAAGLSPATPMALAEEANAEAIAAVAEDRAVEYTPIYEKDEIIAAFQNGGMFELRGSVTLDESLTIPEGVSVVLNLRGYTFNLGANKIKVNGDLQLVNANSGGYEGTLTGDKDVIDVQGGASVTVNGACNVVANTGSAVKLAYRDGISFTLNGGTLTSPGTTLNAMKGNVDVNSGRIETTSEKASTYALGNNYGEAYVSIGHEDGDDSEIYISSIQNKRDGEAPLIIKSGTVGKIAPVVKDADEIGCRLETDISEALPQGLCCVPVTEDDATYYRIAALSAETAGAQIGERYYASAIAAAAELQDNETLTILRDVEGASDSALLAIEARDATVDLNGHSITNNGSGYGIAFKNPYGGEMRECTATVQNSSSTRSEITANIPLSFDTGDSRYTITGQVYGSIGLNSTNSEVSQAYNLGSGARLAYSTYAAEAYGNGGFLADDGAGHSFIYGTYASALDVDADGTIKLLNNYVGSGFIASGDREGVLDMNGNTFTTTGDKVVDVNYDNAALTIKNGALISKHANGNGVVMLNSGTTLELDSVNIDLAGDGFAIVTSGQETENTVLIKNSIIANYNGAGMYFPSTGTVFIDNSNIYAKYMGVQMCAGSLNITDGSNIAVTGEPVQKTENDGPIYDGAAVSIVNRDGYQALGSVNITGGTFTSAAGVDAVKAYSFNNTDKVEGEWAEAADVVNITGGVFSSSPADYMEQGYVTKVEEGTFTVIEKNILGAGVYETAPGDAITEADIMPGLVATVDEETGQIIVGSESGVVEYQITCSDDGNGSVSTNVSKAAVGDTVTITVSPNDGYSFATLSVTDANGIPVSLQGNDDGTFSFTMPNSTVMVNASFNQIIVEHAIDVVTSDHGSVTLSDMAAEEGDTVTFEANADEGFEVDIVEVRGESGAVVDVQTNEDGTYSFSMPAENVTVSVTFKVAEPVIVEHTISVAATPNGSVSTNVTKAKFGETVTITLTPHEGYEVGTVAVYQTDGLSVPVTRNDDGTFSFTMPDGNVNVAVTFDKTPVVVEKHAVAVAAASNGSVSVDASQAEEGATVNITATPDDGFSVGSVSVVTAGGQSVDVKANEDGTFSFVMPGEDVTVSVSFEENAPVIIEHGIAVAPVEHGTTSVDVTRAEAGDVVTVTTSPDEGYELGTITVLAADGTSVAVTQGALGTYTFLMPEQDVTVHTSYQVAAEEAVQHNITLSMTGNGTAKTSVSKAYAGDVVSITAEPADGYEVKAITVMCDGEAVTVDAAGEGAWRFVMPDGDVSVRVEFEESAWFCDGKADCPTYDYVDIDDTAWYHQAVDWAVTHNVMLGYDGHIVPVFGPDDELTRAQMAQILYNMAGQPIVETNGVTLFSDCNPSAWYATAISWAVDEGIFEGYGDQGTFGPEDAFTREQAAVVLMRIAEKSGQDVSDRDDLDSYPDADSVSDWADDAMAWAVAEGIVRGVEAEDEPTTLAPQGSATRAQAAALMMRLVDAGFLELHE